MLGTVYALQLGRSSKAVTAFKSLTGKREMKPVVKLATGAICILILQASNAFAQLPAGCTGLNPATSGAGVESNWDWDEDFSSPFPACDNGVISAATEFLKILPPHGNGVISAATEFLNYANPHDRLRP